jgi:hypothetical protein
MPVEHLSNKLLALDVPECTFDNMLYSYIKIITRKEDPGTKCCKIQRKITLGREGDGGLCEEKDAAKTSARVAF